MKKDKLVLSWIAATIAPSLQTLLLSCSTAADAWTLLDKRLSPLFKVHIRNLREQLRSLKKTPDKPVSEYLLHAKTLSDSLASVGAAICEQDLTDFITEGLDFEYKGFITSLHFQTSKTFDEVYDLLLEEEALVNKEHSLTSSTTALIAHKNTTKSHQSTSFPSSHRDYYSHTS